MTWSASFSYKKLLSSFEEVYTPFIERGLKFLDQDYENLSFTEVNGGISSTKLFFFLSKNKPYVLRVLPQKSSIKKRMAEIEAQKIGASLDIAPKVYYAGPESLVLVMDYISGATLKPKDLKNPKAFKVLAKTLRILHAHDLPFPYVRTQKERVEGQLKKAKKSFSAFPSLYESLYNQYGKEAKSQDGNEQALIHGDLNPSNIMLSDTGKIYFIDWAEASTENKYIDLGMLTFWNGFSASQTRAFMKAYLERDPTNQEMESLSLGQKRSSFLTATIWLRFAEKSPSESTLKKRVEKLDTFMETKLRKIQDYYKKGEAVSLVPGERSSEDKAKYGLSSLQAYRDWATLN
jgi:aminoglycoside phosphotransferase (APT) family kinase protein